MYYGLKELATKADRQDDLLLADFTNLQAPGNGSQAALPADELDIKYTYFRQWIQDALDRAAALNADSFAGAVAYLFLTLIYRIDFLMAPEATLLAELERIHNLYWEKKEEIPLVERNQKMKEAVTALLALTKEAFAASVYTSKSTFAMAAPARMEKVKEHITTANKESRWYVDNKYPELAPVLAEYGVTYDAFISSMPAVLTALSVIVMAVWYPDYFAALGMKNPFYDKADNTFQQAAIEVAVDKAIADFGEKYPELKWDHSRLKWTSQYEFGISFTEQMAGLNMEVKR